MSCAWRDGAGPTHWHNDLHDSGLGPLLPPRISPVPRLASPPFQSTAPRPCARRTSRSVWSARSLLPLSRTCRAARGPLSAVSLAIQSASKLVALQALRELALVPRAGVTTCTTLAPGPFCLRVFRVFRGSLLRRFIPPRPGPAPAERRAACGVRGACSRFGRPAARPNLHEVPVSPV